MMKAHLWGFLHPYTALGQVSQDLVLHGTWQCTNDDAPNLSFAWAASPELANTSTCRTSNLEAALVRHTVSLLHDSTQSNTVHLTELGTGVGIAFGSTTGGSSPRHLPGLTPLLLVAQRGGLTVW